MRYKEVGRPRGRLIPIGVHENTFIHDFLSTFGDKLPFSTSDKFNRVSIERTTLTKEEIKGQLIVSTGKAGYYKANPDINVMYDEEDSGYLNAEIDNNLFSFDKQECDEIEDILQPQMRPPIIENFNSTKDLSFKPTSYARSPMLNTSSSIIVNNHQVQVIRDKTASNKQRQKTSPTRKGVFNKLCQSKINSTEFSIC